MIITRSWIVGLFLTLLLTSTGAAQSGNQAALVVRYDDNRVDSYCVSFTEAEISGIELLERAGVTVEAQEVGMGASVCRLDEVGCSASNCFCQCRGGTCEYWSYWHMNEGEWRYAVGGASISPVGDGDIQGWSWGPGSVTEAIAPPQMTFEEVCAADERPTSSGEQTTAQAAAPASEGQSTTAVSEVAAQENDSAADDVLGDDDETVPGSYLGFVFIVVLLAGLALLALRRRSQ